MAATQNTKSESARAAERVNVEAQAAEIAESFAADVAAKFDETALRFQRARKIAEAVRKGASVRVLATEVTRIRIATAWPHLDGLAVAEYVAAVEVGTKGDDTQKMLAKRVRQQKLSISKSQIDNYNGAWRHVQDSGLTPTAALVSAAFTLKSASGTGDLARDIAEATPKVDESDRAQSYLDAIAVGMETLSAVKKSEGRTGGTVDGPADVVDADEISPVGSGADVTRNVDDVVRYIREVSEYHWSPADADAVLAALIAAQSALMGETVDADLVEA